MGCFYEITDFYKWIEFLQSEDTIPDIFLNIVVTQKNINDVVQFIRILEDRGFITLLRNKISI
jgi:hypothetical protein